MESPPFTLVALLHGPDRPGLVAKTSSWIFENGGNILHADQHRDMEAGIFFQRIEWTSLNRGLAADTSIFKRFAESLNMHVRVAVSTHRPKIALFISKFDHCFHDIVLRWKAGEYRCDIVAVVSNHRDLESATLGYGLPFYFIPITGSDKAPAEEQQIILLQQCNAELLVLARYMQVLSANFIERFAGSIINIHHSFLPAFPGGRPYHQAHERGVKLIGATAHYATAFLDEGPIIHQDVVRVTHRHGVDDLIGKGGDLEKMVLAQAVRWHLENRVLVYGNKTVVFD